MADFLAKKPNFSQGVWANQGELIEPSVDKIEIGHIVEKPPFQMVNWIENRQDQGLLYLFQNGLASWDRSLLYPEKAFVTKSGIVYQALQQNIRQDPETATDYWVKAFFEKSSGDNLKNIVDEILNTDGYLKKYVMKSDPVMDSVAKGTGYAFKDSTNTGLFLNTNGNVIINKSGSETHSFEKISDVFNEDNDKVVRMSDLKKLFGSLQAFPVGSIYITVSTRTPFTDLGYGTWEKFSQGKVLVGQSDNGDDPNWTRTNGSTSGEYTHKLTKSELPNEKIQLNATGYHDYIGNRNGIPRNILNNEYFNGIDKDNSKNPMYTYPLGDGTPFNVVQPSITVTMWKRTG